MSDAIQHTPSFPEMVSLIERLFKDSLEMTKAFTPNQIELEWQRYKVLNHLYQDEQRMRSCITMSNKKYISLPDDDAVQNWFEENINKDCGASSAIYKFRQWLNNEAEWI